MTKRLFTFGCSFTKYHWPTWADIMALDYDVSQNWGKIGAGNHFILYSLVEAIQRNHINKDDTVAVMFTSTAREDRWIDGGWKTTGNVYNSNLPAEYVEKFTDVEGFVITSGAIIDSVVKILQAIGCEHHLFSMVPLAYQNDSLVHKIFQSNNICSQVQEVYKESLTQIHPSVFELIFNGDFNSRDHLHIPWARKYQLGSLEKKYHTCAGKDWPSFADFLQDSLDHVPVEICKEIDTQFDFFTWRNNIMHKRADQHPTPMEHFEYLEKLGIQLVAKQKQFAEHWNHRVLTCEEIDWCTPMDFKRF